MWNLYEMQILDKLQQRQYEAQNLKHFYKISLLIPALEHPIQ